MSGYPPEPWQLRGQLYASAFLLPAADLSIELPPGCSLVRIAGRAVVGVVWVDYEPGGVLAYRELMTTVLVRKGLRVLASITHIWVDSAASRDGGRALWGIPKELAQFSFDGAHLAARDDAGPLARGTVHPGRRLPVRLPMRFTIAQRQSGRAKFSRVRATAAPALARARFEPDPSGPLAFLAGQAPVASFALGDFRMRFGGS
jgi:hypothetical protein